jgi:hypothetical protein
MPHLLPVSVLWATERIAKYCVNTAPVTSQNLNMYIPVLQNFCDGWHRNCEAVVIADKVGALEAMRMPKSEIGGRGNRGDGVVNSP